MKKQYSYEADWKPYVFPEDEAHLASEEELKERYTTVNLDDNTTLVEGGMPVLSDGHTVTINTRNEMTMIYGATGSKKSRVLISILITILAMSGESMIIPDIKGELCKGDLSPKIRGILDKNKYNIRILNFRELNGDGFDLLKTPYILYRSGKRGEAMIQLHHLFDRMADFYKGSISDPIWEKTGKEYLMAVTVLLFELCDEPEKINLLSLASYTNQESCSRLEQIASFIEQDNNIMTMLRSILSEPEKTKMSTLATVSSFFSDLIINEKLMQMLSTSTFELKELYEKKTALFLILPDEVDTYNFVAGLILSQISAFLVESAYMQGGKLPRRVNYICDEFCNYYIPGMDRNISAHRSRNIRWYLVCQSKKQLKRAYVKEAEIILANCVNTYFMGSPDMELLEELSERAGYTYVSADGSPKRLISVENLRNLYKGWEYSEVYFSADSITCVSFFPDIEQYEFLDSYKTIPKLVQCEWKELQIYTSEQMLHDLYHAKQAYQNKISGKWNCLSDEEKEKAEKYRGLFQKNSKQEAT